MGVTKSDPHLSPTAPNEHSTGWGEEFLLTIFPLFALPALFTNAQFVHE
jgi:hypothetical protein